MRWCSRLLQRAIMTTPELAPKMVPIPPRGVDYRGKVVLAPMVRSGELPCRLLALHYGADLVWGPETVDHALVGSTRRVNPRTGMVEWSRIPSNNAKAPDATESVIYRLDPHREAGKLIFQIGTSDADRAVAAARMVAADVAGIDVNAGCPKPFSTSGGMGAALLRTPDKLVRILEALVREIVPEFGIGVSVKIRLLETAEETEALVRRLVATGITGLTVHCRTTPMRPRERAIRGQLRMVGEVCREAGVACVMNGDVEGRDQAVELMREFGVDGAMIATAAEKNPSVFRAAADGGKAEWKEMAQQFVRYAMEVENKYGNTKFSLAHLVKGAHQIVSWTKTYEDVVKSLEMGEEALKRAIEVDNLLKKPPPPPKPPKAKKLESPAKRKKGSQGGWSPKSPQSPSSPSKKQRVVEGAPKSPPRAQPATEEPIAVN
ncbi:dihydrouridine synthase [Podospora aff. communis PSN243]|uniref:Dihydrouridine synthase n=1 Tax=Podospora aff. communis PSN243 TaxID=3040156 RepID=A0AAV9GKA8_9PEZI|nr:dihydrouridine synthase [Podospora aff. communis PSN243]